MSKLTRTRLAHQPALDGIRGVAVIGVLLFHGDHLAGGYLGVDAFFVLSGFLITSLLLTEAQETAKISLLAFWGRRFRRLMPAVAAMLALVAAYAWLVADSADLRGIRSEAFATLIYWANWHQISVANDYFQQSFVSPLQHTWSLAIEEQFYVVWPFVVFLITRFGSRFAARRVLAMSLVVWFASALAAQILYDSANPLRVYFGTDTRIGAIAIGAALGAWTIAHGHVRSTLNRVYLEVAGWVSVAGLAFAWTHLEGTSPILYRGGLLLCGVAATVVIAAGVHPRRMWVTRVFSLPIFRAAGLISYGLYLWHWPIFVWLDAERAHLGGWPLLSVRMAVTLGVAAASYRWIETPIRRGWGSARLMGALIPTVAAILGVVIIASTRTETAHQFKGRGGVMIVGDSVARSLARGFEATKLAYSDKSLLGCRLLNGDLDSQLKEKTCNWRPFWQQAIANQDPEVVVVVIGLRDMYDVRLPGTESFVGPGDPTWNHTMESTLNEALSILTSSGAHVVIPNFPCNSQTKLPASNRHHPLGEDSRRAALQRVFDRVSVDFGDQVSTPDLDSLLCPTGTYQRELGSIAKVRRDGLHFTVEGAEFVARWLVDVVPQAFETIERID